MNVRDKLPKRRINTTKNPTGKNWTQHKPDLKEDFNSICAYCGSFDGYKHTYFEVDHFIPKSFFEKNGNIEYCQYDNLVYSCKFCNNNKGKLWPTNDEKITCSSNKGFIDPCNEEYDKHLYRTKDGGIMWKTQLGKWMAVEAFKFDIRQTGIKILWELNQARKIIDVLIYELSKRNEDSKEYKNIRLQAEKLSFPYFQLHKKLMDYYNNL